MMKPSIAAAGGALPSRYLCLCADDFGMSANINAAIFDLADRGRISSTGCMVRRDAWAAGSRGLRAMQSTRLEVGLHLDLSCPPRGGEAEPALSRLILESYLGLLRPPIIQAEIKEQLTRFEDGLGRPPAFVDGHRHVHQLPGVRDVLAEEIASRYGALKPWIRSTAPIEARRIPGSKADIVYVLGGAALLAAAARHAIPTSRGLLGVYGFTGSAADYRKRLQRWASVCRTGDVLMCHPSLGETPSDPIAAARLNEYAVLRDITFPMDTEAGPVSLAPLSCQWEPR